MDTIAQSSTVDARLYQSSIGKEKKWVDQLILHYTHEKRLESYKRDIHQIWNQVFKNTPVSDLKEISQNITSLLKQSIAFSMFDDRQRLAKDLSRDAASFLWFQMLLDVLKGIDPDMKEKRDMLAFCRRVYSDNETQLDIIKEFDKSYNPAKAIWWYTRECFLYRLVNKALRQEDIVLLHLYRFFVVDLCSQLEAEHRNRVQNDSGDKNRIICLYRGQQLSKNEVDKLKSNVNTLISTNGFFSTSTDEDTAKTFAKQRRTVRSDIVSVIFRIRAQSNLESVIFADIAKQSAMSHENEYLFSVGAVFHIDKVAFDKTENIWQVDMTATDEGARNRREYIERTRMAMEETNENVLFGRLLIDMGQYDDAEKYYEKMLSMMSPTHVDINFIYHNLGRAKGYKGDLEGAQINFSRALQSLVRDRRQMDVARTQNSMGIVEGEQGKYEKAMNTFNEALEIQENYLKSLNNDSSNPQKRNISLNIAITHTNIAWVHFLRGQYEKAKEKHKKALDVRQQFLPEDHPLIADYYSSIGSIAHAQGFSEEARENYIRSLNIRLDTLPSNHPSVANSYQLLGELEHDNGKYDKAIDLYETVKQMRIASVGADHASMAGIYKSIGNVHLDCGRYKDALENYDLALSICRRTLSEIHPAYGDCYHMFGMVSERKGEYDAALAWYSKAYDNIAKRLPKSHPMIAKVLSSIGNVHMRQQKYDQALSEYEKVIEIQKQCLSTAHHPEIVLTLNNFGVLWNLKGDFDQSEMHFKQALEMCDSCFKNEHPSKARILHNMGELYKAMGNLDEALAKFLEAYTIRENTLSDDHLSTADTCYKLGWVCFELGNMQDALYYFNKCLGIYEPDGTTERRAVDQRDLKRVKNSITLVRKELEIP